MEHLARVWKNGTRYQFTYYMSSFSLPFNSRECWLRLRLLFDSLHYHYKQHNGGNSVRSSLAQFSDHVVGVTLA